MVADEIDGMNLSFLILTRETKAKIMVRICRENIVTSIQETTGKSVTTGVALLNQYLLK